MKGQKAFFIQRMNDHIQYLDKITQTIRGKGDFRGCDCHCCKLGTWLYSTGKEDIVGCIDDQGLFESLVERHEQFHAISAQVVEAYDKEDQVSAYRAMTEMHKLSAQLVNMLLTMDRKSRLTA